MLSFSPFPKSRLQTLFEKIETCVQNPNILARKAEAVEQGKSVEKIEEEALAYCEEVGLKDVLLSGDNQELSPVFKDLFIIHKLIRSHRPNTVVEFGVGFSTITIAHALKMNQNGFLYTVDADKAWLENTEKKIPDDLKAFAQLNYSPVRCHMINGQLCTLYDNLPNVMPDFIYLDAPCGRDVEGDINGLTFDLGDRLRPAVAADPLLYEGTAKRSFFILVDGRACNVEFLRQNLKGRFRFHQSTVMKQSYFEKL